MVERIRTLEERIKELEGRREGKGGKTRERGGMMEERIREMENREEKLEKRERKEKRRNVILKEIEVRDGDKKETIKGIFRSMGVEIEEIRRLGRSVNRGTKMVWVKLGSEE